MKCYTWRLVAESATMVVTLLTGETKITSMASCSFSIELPGIMCITSPWPSSSSLSPMSKLAMADFWI